MIYFNVDSKVSFILTQSEPRACLDAHKAGILVGKQPQVVFKASDSRIYFFWFMYLFKEMADVKLDNFPRYAEPCPTAH